jgi:hypothetical protein
VVAEQRVNSTPLQTFSFGTPFEGFTALRNEFADRNNRRLSFTCPKSCGGAPMTISTTDLLFRSPVSVTKMRLPRYR